MMRRFVRMMMLVFLGLFLSAQTMADPMVNLVLMGSPMEVGDTFDVQVWADGDGIEMDLITFGFDVAFIEGGVFSYDGFTVESGFDDWSMGPANVTADVFPGISENDVLLATLSFSTLDFGTDTLSVHGLYDAMFTGLIYETPEWETYGFDIDASLTISAGERPVPEPATLLMLVTGMLGWTGFRRRSKQ